MGGVENFVVEPGVFSRAHKKVLFKIGRKLREENIGSGKNQIFPSMHWVTRFPLFLLVINFFQALNLCCFFFFKLQALSLRCFFILFFLNVSTKQWIFLFLFLFLNLFYQRWGPWWLPHLFFFFSFFLEGISKTKKNKIIILMMC